MTTEKIGEVTHRSTSKLGGKSLKAIFFGVGIVVGMAVLLIIRYATYMPEMVHYHANFAVYLNGKREQFQGPQYYQDVSMCNTANGISNPEQRAHMHNNINSVVHIHDHAATWGQFFNNLGWSVGINFVETDDGTLYVENGNSQLHVIINNQDYTDINSIANMVIQDQSRLLVSFGDVSNGTVQQEYKSVPSTAKHYDETMDPMSCSGSEKITVSERLHHLF